MAMLAAYSTKDLQQCTHILEQYSDVDIETVKKELSIEVSSRIADMKQPLQDAEPVKEKSNTCHEEECDGILVVYPRTELDGSVVIIEKCEKCASSRIVDQGIQ